MKKQGSAPSFVVRATFLDGREIAIPLNMEFGWQVIEGIHTLGIDNAVKFAQLIVYLDRRTMGYPPGLQPPADSNTLDDITHINLEAIIKILAGYTNIRPDAKRTDRLFYFIHKAVQSGASWNVAASFASRELGKPLTPTALRLRVRRWTDEERKKRSLEGHNERSF